MARRPQDEDVVGAKVAIAKARLLELAAEMDARQSVVGRTASLVRHQPWAGIGVAVLIGVALGATRRSTLPLLAPMASRLASGLVVPIRRRSGARR
jgi:hypothetical protein